MKIKLKFILQIFLILIVSLVILPMTRPSMSFISINEQKIESYSSYYPPFVEVFNVKEQMTLSPIFTPDNALDTYLYWINRANISIYIQNPYFTEFNSDPWPFASPLVKAIVDAKNKGVTDIKIQVNEESGPDTVTNYFKSVGIPIRWMGNSTSAVGSYISITHNKLLIIDNKIVIISSINFSENAFLNNREAGMVIQDENISLAFNNVFQADWDDGEIPTLIAMNNQNIKTIGAIGSYESINPYVSPTNIPKTNFTGIYNVSVFTNPDNADNFIFQYLQSAKESIYVSMYTISRLDFNNTLINLKKQNPLIDIQVLISRDRVGSSEDEDTFQSAQSLVENLIPVYNSTLSLKYYHNKYWIIDGKTTFVYSGNWSPNSVTPNATTYSSGGQNRDMGIAVHDASDIAEFFTEEVWKKDVASGSAWELPVGVTQQSFEQGDVISGNVTLQAISNLNTSNFYYKWNDNDFIEGIVTDNIFQKEFDTKSLPNGVNTFEVKIVSNTNVIYSDIVNVTVANYNSEFNNWRVLITEVLANPSTTTDVLGEFYEITNSFPFDVLLEGWTTGVKVNSFSFPKGYIIKSYSSIIFASDLIGFKEAFSKTADFSYSFSLANTADYVYLKNNKNLFIDVVAYGMDAPDLSDSLEAASSGKSLQRFPIYTDTNTVKDFIEKSPTPKEDVSLVSLFTNETKTANISTIHIFLSVIIVFGIIRLKKKINK
jgi:phosphatidylserine/phosphatidylglycerophosphate/cardiolipin synthase-like enzyme